MRTSRATASRERVRLVDEKAATYGFRHQRLDLGRRLSHEASLERHRVLLDERAVLEDAVRVQEPGQETGEHRLAHAGVAREDHVDQCLDGLLVPLLAVRDGVAQIASILLR